MNASSASGIDSALPVLFEQANEASASAAEVDWYVDRLPRDAGLTLDVLCGSGRLLVPLVGRNVRMHGIEPSTAHVAACLAHLQSKGMTAEVVRQDASELNLPFRYACAFFANGAFQRLTRPLQARASLERVRAHLVAPGVVIVHLHVPEDRLQKLAAPLVEIRTSQLADGTRIALRSETTVVADERIATIERRYVHRRGNVRIAEESATLRTTWYSREEISAMVERAGFRDVSIEPVPFASGESDHFALIARI